MANWKIYTNQLGFTIEIPNSWKIYAADTSTNPDDPVWNYLNHLEPNQLGIISFRNDEEPYFNLSLDLKISTNIKNLTSDSWAESFFVPLATDPKTNLASPAGQLTISGLPAKRFNVFAFMGYNIITGIVYKNKIFEFSYLSEAGDPNSESKSQLYDQILS